MPRRRNVQGPPAQFLAEGDWPKGRLADDAPVYAYYAVEVSQRLQAALAGRNQSEVASEADLARSTIHDLVTGRQWPDFVTLAKLETLLGVRLWPDASSPGKSKSRPRKPA